jgi:RNA polymerase sigma factor (sigma-70 family)
MTGRVSSTAAIAMSDLLWQKEPSANLSRVLRNGDADLFRLVVAEMTSVIERHLGRSLHNTSDRDEVISRVWATAFLKRHSFTGRGPIAHWIIAIAKRELQMFLRAQKRARVFAIGTDDLDQYSSRDDAATYRAIVQEHDAFIVRELIQRLPRRQAEVVRARLDNEESFESIGKRLGVRPSTARAAFRDAVQHLRATLSRNGTLGDYTFSVERHLYQYDDWYVMLGDSAE